MNKTIKQQPNKGIKVKKDGCNVCLLNKKKHVNIINKPKISK